MKLFVGLNVSLEKTARRNFSREFKIEAVRLVTERGVAVPQAARVAPLDTGITATCAPDLPSVRKIMPQRTARP
jgi:hypothetical protein